MKPLDQPDELQAYYRDEGIASDYLERRTAQPLNGLLHSSQVSFLNRVVHERRPGRVLEIAPGPARLTAELDFPGPGVVVDFSPAMLSRARARLRERGMDWLVLRGDAFSLPVGEGSFDFVYTLKFVRHFQPADRRRLYGEIRRVLAPGGTFALDAQNRAVSLPHRRQKGLDRYPIFDILYQRDELVAELEGAGFRVVRIEGMINHFKVQQKFNRLRRVGLGTLARKMIDAVERLPTKNPSTWMVLNEVV